MKYVNADIIDGITVITSPIDDALNNCTIAWYDRHMKQSEYDEVRNTAKQIRGKKEVKDDKIHLTTIFLVTFDLPYFATILYFPTFNLYVVLRVAKPFLFVLTL